MGQNALALLIGVVILGLAAAVWESYGRHILLMAGVFAVVFWFSRGSRNDR